MVVNENKREIVTNKYYLALGMIGVTKKTMFELVIANMINSSFLTF